MTAAGSREEWAALVAAWRGGEPGPAADVLWLRRRVDTRRRRMAWLVAGEVVLTVVCIAAAAYAVVAHPGVASQLLAADCGLLLAATWAFALWNRRGTWRPLTETTDSFVALARLRCERQMRALGFALGVIAVQLLVVALWALWSGVTGRGSLPLPRWLSPLPVLVTVGFLAWIGWSYRRTRRELARLDAFSYSLGDGSVPDA